MEYTPWVEKYRPKKLSNIVCHKNIIKSLGKMIKSNVMPHLLLYGNPGTGKTSTILSLTKKIYGNNASMMVLELNASDDRGINSVREDIKKFAESDNIFNRGIKLIILDEADSMTYDAQFALRRIIEKYSPSTRFCLICNYMNKIVPAIISRCLLLRFTPIDNDGLIKYIKIIEKNENLNMDNDVVNTLCYIANGDMRKAVNTLQSASLISSHITSELCNKMFGYPSKEEIINLLDVLILSKNYKYNMDYMLHYINKKKYSLIEVTDLLGKQFIVNYRKYKLSNEQLIKLMIELSDVHYKLTNSTDENIFTGSIVSIFYLN
jgi:replication factor C subunit 3/5